MPRYQRRKPAASVSVTVTVKGEVRALAGSAKSCGSRNMMIHRPMID